jgi:hypothetical protein
MRSDAPMSKKTVNINCSIRFCVNVCHLGKDMEEDPHGSHHVLQIPGDG